ncbi:GNAT family N-acetyltransferase [Solitalea lacus]|uniref:GNAT family N-acetyltransferase n=1 Tax=Solitalea lacus TaxID=2911172 RepID=UPI001EDA6BB8|nr:GNAT family N-acetyltransferase [Solitalea lacus]UKJ06221.1 GNAT family N-acetyltransferase [Solitalea lacus]
MKIIRTNSENPDFIALVKLLDIDLVERYGEKQAFFSQFNKLDSIKNSVVVYHDDELVACGAFKEYIDQPNTVEIKRMYVSPAYRNQGIAKLILNELEKWAKELNFEHLILETGNKQPEAIRLYEKYGFNYIPNYGQYIGVEESLCMQKKI